MTTYKISADVRQQTISQTSARLAIWASGLFLALLMLLHFIEPEFAPSWRFISEYSNGSYGWVMKLAFFSLGIANIALYFSIRSQVSGLWGKIGLTLLIVAAIAPIGGGLFDMDPLNTSKDQLTNEGNLHGMAAMIGIPATPIAALLISFNLVKRNQAWSVIRRSLLLTAHLTWISVVIMFATMFISLGKTQGVFGPDTPIGWPNRFLVVCGAIWVITVARHAIRLTASQLKTNK